MQSLLLFLTLLPLSAQTAPVLVELFTSEGCSSCPPADALLARLEKEQPGVIVLSEHVDYWNDLGWRDPFSSAQFSRRQSVYAGRLNAQGNYTPQMVVDGRAEFVGSDGRRARAEIAQAAQRPKVTVQLTSIERKPGAWTIRIDLPGASEAADVMVALVEPGMAIKVARGENGGRELRHVGVVRSLVSAGRTAPGAAFSKQLVLDSASAQQRAVVFLQARNQGPILGAALLP